jgi:hypothetical protein
MPPPERANLTQYAVLWPLLGHDHHNEPLIGDPVELRIRVLLSDGEAAGTKFGSHARETEKSVGGSMPMDAMVILEQDVKVGDILWIGRLADWTPVSPGLLQVGGTRKTFDVRGREVMRVAGVKRYKDALPPRAP